MDKNKIKKNVEEFSVLDDIPDVVSATECTGLMSTPPRNEQEAEAYSKIYNVPKQVNSPEKKHKK